MCFIGLKKKITQDIDISIGIKKSRIKIGPSLVVSIISKDLIKMSSSFLLYYYLLITGNHSE